MAKMRVPEWRRLLRPAFGHFENEQAGSPLEQLREKVGNTDDTACGGIGRVSYELRVDCAQVL